MRKVFLCTFLLLAGSLSCTDKQDSTVSPTAAKTSTQGSTSPGSNNVVISGTLAIGEVPASTQGSGISLGSREVNIVDGSGNVIASSKTASDGSYAVIAPGVLMIDSESLALTDTSAKLESIVSNTEDGAVIGVQKGLAAFDISGGAMKVGRSELKKITALRGKAMLDGARDHTGILVYVPGTSYQARTDSAGQFLMTFIPAGNYDLRFEKDGYISSTLSGAIVTENETTQIDQRTLKLSGGATDITVRQVGIQGLSKTRTVSFEITPGTADRFKGGLQADIETAAYAAVPSIFNYTFNADGLFTLKLMFANADGFETTVERTILVDTASPSSNGLRLVDRTTLNNNFTNERFVIAYHDTCADIQALAILPATVASPSSADFIYNCYTTYSNAAQFVLPAGVSSYSYKIWARDQVGNISATASTGTIGFDNTPPSPASVILADQTLTGNVRFDGTDQTTVDVDVTSCTDTAFLLLSETQSLPPEPSQFSIPCVVGPSRFVFMFANNVAGSKKVFAWSMDQAGNVSTTATIETIILDQSKPISPSFILADPSSTTASYSNSNLLTASISNCNDITHLFIAENQIAPPSENSTGWLPCASSITGIQAPTEGMRTFYLWVKDTAGNISLSPTTNSITIDKISPASVSVSITDVTTGSLLYTNDRNVQLQIVCADSAMIFVTESSTDQPLPADFSSPCTASFNYTFSSNVEGLRGVYVWGQDYSGNISLTAGFSQINLDITPPALPSGFGILDQSSGNSSFTNDIQVAVVTSGCEVGSFIYIAEATYGNPPPSEHSFISNCGQTTTFNFSSIAQGQKELVLWTKDLAGNLSSSYISRTIELDQYAPYASYFELSDPTVVSYQVDYSYPFTVYSNSLTLVANYIYCGDAAYVLIGENQSMFPSESDVRWVLCSSTISDIVTHSDGEKTFNLWAKDAAGNISFNFSTQKITIDTVKPQQVVSAKLSDKTNKDVINKFLFTNNVDISVVDLNCDDVRSIYITEVQSEVPSGTNGSENFVPCSPDPISYSLSSSTEGPKTVYIWGRDRAGNVSINSISLSITLDTTPPSQPTTFSIYDPSNGSQSYTNERVRVESDGCEAGSLIYLKDFGGELPTAQAANNEDLFTNSPQFCGTFDMDLLASQGVHHVALWIKDEAGNINTEYLHRTINFDNIPPAPTTLTLRDQNYSSDFDVQPNIITYTKGQAVSVNLGSCDGYEKILVTSSPTASEGAISETCTATAYSHYLMDMDGVQTVYVHAKDIAGNIRTLSAQITLDRLAPVILESSFNVAELNVDRVKLNWSTAGTDPIFSRLSWGLFGGSLSNQFTGQTSTSTHSVTVGPEAPVAAALSPDTKYSFSALALDHAFNQGVNVFLDVLTPVVYKITGEPGKYFGSLVGQYGESRTAMEMCDINGDGLDDLFVTQLPTLNSSKISVYFGSSAHTSASRLSTQADFVIVQAQQGYGFYMKCADLVPSAPNEAPKKELLIGQYPTARILKNQATFPDTIYLPYDTDNSFRVTFSDYSQSGGFSLATGKINSDEFDDFVLCTPGSTTGTSHCEGWLGGQYFNYDDTIRSNFSLDVSHGENIGRSIAIADVDGDGYGDIVTTGYYQAVGSWQSDGVAHVYKGSNSPSGVLSRTWTILGPPVSADLAVVNTGDLDNDGFKDIVLATAQNTHMGVKIAIVFGRSYAEWPASEIQLTTQDILLKSPANGPHSGFAGESSNFQVTDSDGDGKTDLIIGGAGFNGRNGAQSGISCVFKNRLRAEWLAIANLRDDFDLAKNKAEICFLGSSAEVWSGQAITVGNFMGTLQSRPEIVIAEPYYDATLSGLTSNHGIVSVIQYEIPTFAAKPLLFDLYVNHKKQ